MFATTIYLTRTYPIDIYGQFRLIFAFLALSVILFQFGRDNSIIYYGQSQKTPHSLDKLIKSEILFTALGLIFGATLLYFLTPYIIDWFFNNEIKPFYFQISLVMIPLWGTFNALIAAMKAKTLINQSFLLANFTQRLLRFPFLLSFSLISISYYSLALGMIASQVVLIIIAWRALKLRYHLADTRLLKDFFKRFGYSLQLGINAIIFVLLSKIDVIMLGKISTNSSVAIYDTVVLLGFIVTLPFVALVKASEAFMQALIKDENVQEKYKYNLKLAVHLSMAVTLFILLAPQEILHIFGYEYIVGYRALMIMAIGYLILNLLGAPIEILNMNGLGKISSLILITTVLLNILLNSLLIPIYNIEGAAFATFISLLFSKILALYISKKIYPSIKIVTQVKFSVFALFILILAIGYFVMSNSWFLNLIYTAILTSVFCIMSLFLLLKIK